MKLARKHTIIVVEVAVILAAILVFWVVQVHNQDVRKQYERASMNADAYTEELSKDFERGIAITETLEAMLLDNNGRINNFDKTAKRLMQDYIGSIQLAPGGIVQQIYPLDGNEAGKLDLLHDPERKMVATYSKEHNVVTAQGPFELKQGGQGIAIRNPVYLRDENGKRHFWGFTIVIIKSPEIFNDSLKALKSFGYQYTLDETNPVDGGVYHRIAGTIDADQKLQDAVTSTFRTGASEWILSVEPAAVGIGKQAVETLLGGLLFYLLFVFMIYLILRQMEQKQQLHELADSAEAANKAKTAFLSNMAHDIRTPLNAVIGLSNIASKHLDDREKTEYYIDEIGIAGNQLLNLINSILEITRIESNKLEIEEALVDTEEVYTGLKTVFLHQAKAKHLTFNFSNTIEHRYVYMDRPHVEEFLVNIVSNAMKYTPDGGCVDVSFSELAGSDADHVLLRSQIKDNGIGMSEEFQERLFQKFERENSEAVSKIHGTGLGMSIVKHLVDKMGGTIEVNSRQGLGTVITVDVEYRIGKAPTECEQAQQVDPSVFRGKRILLAEDNASNAMIAEEILTESGVIVELAENGQQCLDMLKQAAAGYYDLILMDVNMPVMDGYQATKSIRRLEDEAKSSIPIVAMTANAFEEDKVKVLEVGMDEHLTKPIDVEHLFATLRKILRLKNG